MKFLKRTFVDWFGFTGEQHDAERIASLPLTPLGADTGISEALVVGDGDKTLRLVVLSDTHLEHPDTVPEGDVLIHLGDFLHWNADESEIQRFNDWLSVQPHRHKFLVMGNHEVLLADNNRESLEAIFPGAVVLHGTVYELEGIKIFGSPCTHARPFFYRASAFSKDAQGLVQEFEAIDDTIDIVLTHVPPLGVLDRTYLGHRVGSGALLDRILEQKPKLHCFGHNHDETGVALLGDMVVVNVAQKFSDRGPFIIDFLY